MSSKRRRFNDIKDAIVDESMRNDAIEEFNYYRSMWKKRKDLCIDAIDNIADGMEKPRKHVIVCGLYFLIYIYIYKYIILCINERCVRACIIDITWH